MSVLQTVQKNNRQFTYGQTVQKNCTGAFTVLQTVQKTTDNLHMDKTVQKNNKQFTYGQDSAKKQQTIYIWTDSAKKLHWSIYSAPDSAKNNNSNLHMDRQCKKTTNNLHMDRQCKKATAIYIWTDSAKKQQQFTYGQYIFTDCTEDNVQNTHTYTQYT